MDPNLIFAYKYNRLRELLNGDDRLQLLDVSAILREFLIDSPNIVEEVNRDFRYKIHFRVHESSKEQYERDKLPGTIVMFVMSGTTRPPSAKLTSLTLDKFLKHEIMSFQDTHFTVHQIVKACANQFGGKHYEDSKKDDEETAALRYLDTRFRVGGASGVFSSLRLIGEITLEALQELFDAASDPKRTIVPRWPPRTNA